MFRCFIISLSFHALLIVTLVVFSILSPPQKRLRPMQISLLSPAATLPTPKPLSTPKPPSVEVTPVPTAAPTPVPTPPPVEKKIVRPKPTPKPIEAKKPKESVKKVVKKKPEIVEKEPTPTPTPAPKTTPAPTPRPTPRATPAPTPKATPKPTPAAVPQIDPSLFANKKIESRDRQVSVESNATVDLSQTYFRIALQKVEENFRPPLTRPGLQCKVKFTILKDGTITGIQIVQSSGAASLDQFAVRALQETGKLPELYESFRRDYLDVTFTFVYEKRN